MAHLKTANRVHRRILVKLSGEALLGAADYGIDPADPQARGAARSRDVREHGHRRWRW